ncbi:UPF0764 protein C16orf89 homolog [Andrena cerasifolii]|uniref:UPF0764 protein C16orf89 homolog n=1 Tax=Andrena cerasifolii TaxID=2819439 RepID=UPI004037B655
MEGLGRVFSAWVMLLLCGCSPGTYGKFVAGDFEEKLIALSKVVDYIGQRPQQMNADATFSVTIVEANIAATLLHKNARYLEDKYWQTLVGILKLCDSTRRYLVDTIDPENTNVQLLHESLNNPALWMRPISWRNGALDKGSSTSNSPIHQDIRDLIMQGTPKEKESDRCLAEIVRNKLNLDDQIPELCVDILERRGPTRGYPLTHRLLIVQVARAMKCERGLPRRPSDLVASYCSAILRDLADIEAAGFPYNTADLMMEQVLLCGMEGFLEFAGQHYERLVLNLPRSSGCFSSFGTESPKSQLRVTRRSSTATDFGCDSHATGIAAASLSLFIRQNVENAIE